MKEKAAVYTGSFDPFHLGHENIVRRACKLFDRVIVGVGHNPEKKSAFSADERVEMIADTLSDLPSVSVKPFTGLAVTFVKEVNAKFFVRGIRALSDIEYEFTMSLTNSTLEPDLETVFLMAQKEFTHLSSSLIRQIAHYGGDLSGFVPKGIETRLLEKYGRRVPHQGQ